MGNYRYSFWIIALLLAWMMRVSCTAQTTAAREKRFYFSCSTGYAFTGFGMSNSFGVDRTLTNHKYYVDSYSGRPVRGSLAKGFDVGVQLGYRVNKFFGVELGLGSLVRGSYGVTITNVDSSGNMSWDKDSYHVTLLRFCPAISLELADNRFHPYTRTGLIIGIPLFARYQNISHQSDTMEYITTYALKGNLSWGFFAAIGARYDLNDRVSLSAELCGILESWAPAKASMLSDLRNGTDQMWLKSEFEKEIIYSSSFTNTFVGPPGNNTIDTSKPQNQSKNYLPFSSLEMVMGIHIKIGK